MSNLSTEQFLQDEQSQMIAAQSCAHALAPPVNIPQDIERLQSMGILDRLLIDRTTKHNLTWATDTYAELGKEYQAEREILPKLITGENSGIIKARAAKDKDEQSARTRQKGEVFTPAWICKTMCDHGEAVVREKAKDWRAFVDSMQLEITCGEAPFLVSRYDVQNGESIPIPNRVGLLDRKLREVGAHTHTEESWLQWARRAYEATYGYEYQGDNLLIARVNMMMTFIEYFEDRFGHSPNHGFMGRLATVVSWNLWQMNGLTGRIPVGVVAPAVRQLSLFEPVEEEPAATSQSTECRIYDWRTKTVQTWSQLGETE